MAPEAPIFCSTEHWCITCADEGVEVRVVGISADGMAECLDPQGAAGVVDAALVGEVVPGDVLLAHAGVAIARLSAGAVGA